MATTWAPRTALDKKSWLLHNGEIVEEPPLEESSSGLKVRLAGTTVSTYAKDIDDLLVKGVQELAKQKQTKVWMPLWQRSQAERQALGFTPSHQKAELHYVTAGRSNETVAWWRFKHPTMPIEAVLVVSAGHRYRYNSALHDQTVTGRVTLPFMGQTPGAHATVLTETETSFHQHLCQISDYNEQTRFREFVRDHQPDWIGALGEERTGSPRQSVALLLRKVRQVDALPSITVPDLRDPEAPAWLELELFETNVNEKFIADMVDYLDGAPSVEQAAQLYTELIKTFQSIGMVIPEKHENDFLTALVSGEKDALRVHLGNADDVGHQKDHNHTLSVDLRTGTMIVNCAHQQADRNTIAEKWDEQLMLAQMTGREEEFLAYARGFSDEANKDRKKRILKERRSIE